MNELYHHGVKGQKWGVRRYQNADGTLTESGKKKYAKQFAKDSNSKSMSYSKIQNKYTNNGFLKSIVNNPSVKEQLKASNEAEAQRKQHESFLESLVNKGKTPSKSDIDTMKKLNDICYERRIKLGKAIGDYLGKEKLDNFYDYETHINDYLRSTKSN